MYGMEDGLLYFLIYLSPNLYSDANFIACCFEISKLLWITQRIFKHDLEQWSFPFKYIKSRDIRKDVTSPSPWLYGTKSCKNKGK